MIYDDGWLELTEISLSSSNEGATNPTLLLDKSDTIALHLFYSRGNPQNGHTDGDDDGTVLPLSSVILQSYTLPESIMMGTIQEGILPLFTLRLHPLLFIFLDSVSTETNLEKSSDKGQQQVHDCSSNINSSGSVKKSSSKGDCIFQAEIIPLPMLEFQYFQLIEDEKHQQLQLQNKRERVYSWYICPMTIKELEIGSHIFISCVYVENNELRNDHSQSQSINLGLEGRMIKVRSVLLLSTTYGYVIVSVTNITTSAGRKIENGFIYRLSENVLDDYHCHIEGPPIIVNENEKNVQSHRTTLPDGDIPGYEKLLRELIDLFQIHGDPSATSGVILAGCAGIGKTRMASCIEEYYNSLNRKSYYISIQDLLYHASVETNIFDNILSPKLRGCAFWIIDDLNLLEVEEGSGADFRRDAESVMVLNAIVEAIDRFHSCCCILGLAQSELKLPSEIVKPGRLEKTMQMLQPTQAQRIEIWKNILVNDGIFSSSSINNDWLLTLASATAGCVAKDLLRVYGDAKTKCWVRQQENNSALSTLEWEDFREAIKSAIPSQLSELDVIKPTIFDQKLSWNEVYQRSLQGIGGYTKIKKDVFRQVVAPWKRFLKNLDDSALNCEEGKIEKDWLEPPPGVIFHGPSGNGKTALAKCMANSLQLPIIQVRAADILDKWLGGSEAILRSLFSRARIASPCVLFLDEIDSIACNRGEGQNNDVSSRILSTLLNEMDGVSTAIKNSRVLVIACTNRISSIDSALLRPGRLQEHFYVSNPNVKDLQQILELRLNKISLDRNISLEDIASRLFDNKATAADVGGLCREVVFIAMRRINSSVDDISVSKKDFDCALRERFIST